MTSSKSPRWGGARANSGGPRPNSGGVRPGSGPKPKPKLAPILATELRWRCVRTVYQGEATAAAQLGLAGFEVFYPTRWLPGSAARRDGASIRPATVDRVEPLFPRYVLVRFALTNPEWREIRGMDGVDHILADTPETPTPVPDEAIAWVREMCAVNDCLYPPNVDLGVLAPGADVRLLGGALASAKAIYRSSTKKRVQLLMRFMNRDVMATLSGSLDQIEAA